jgi:thiamine pyrophosphokinase
MSSFRVCADGGANRLFDATGGGNDYIPDLIRGDLDSLRPTVQEHYAGLGTRVEEDPDQDTNDLDKCLQIVGSEWLNHNCCDHRVCVYGAFGGRFDQEMASIQALFKWREVFHNRLFLYDDRTSAFLLSQDVVNEIRLPFYGEMHTKHPKDLGDGPTCGLVPIGSKCDVVKTSGLKWDLDGSVPLEFGGLVSTSNRVMDPVVFVESSHPLIFTAEVYHGPRILRYETL